MAERQVISDPGKLAVCSVSRQTKLRFGFKAKKAIVLPRPSKAFDADNHYYEAEDVWRGTLGR
jgi:hypothetical protein